VGNHADAALVRAVAPPPNHRSLGERGRHDPAAGAMGRGWTGLALAATRVPARCGGRARGDVHEGGMTATGAVGIREVTKSYGRAPALKRVDLEIPAGSFFSLLGPSGCGKTTLLKIIAGLEAPDTGVILADGDDITARPPERRPFNMVFQHYALFPHMTVADNVGF